MPTLAYDNPALAPDALEAAVRAADPAALIVPPWFLQKLVNYDRGPAAAVFAVPRVAAHAIARDRLLDIVQREELPLDTPIPDRVSTIILLARPDPDLIAATTPDALLLRYWRLLFHARVVAAYRALFAAGDPSPRAAVQRRIERLGRTVFNEARFVLQRERYLPHNADDAESFAEFAACYLEFTCFAPEWLPWFFPAVTEPAAAVRLFEEDVDADSLLRSTRPVGAADPHHDLTPANPAPPTPAATKSKRRQQSRDARRRDKLLAAADKADALGNDVRAALYRMRVYRASGAPGPARDALAAVYADALRDLDQLTARLKAALHLSDPAARQWRAWLVALLENAATGWWNAEGRLLYDLQKACVYHEREIYSVNVIDYLVDRARRPLRRPQPGQRAVLALKSLRSALRRTARARLSPHGRSELQRLLRAAVHDAQTRLRDSLRPPITGALADGGLRPETPTETVAHAKLTEELLDEVEGNGYLTFGGLRDAVSRNQMKLNDLASREDFVRGDQLLQIDRKLEDNLDYVYRRGEIYLRTFHRVSSLFFATAFGRLLTKWAILPFGGAFLILEFLDHSVGLLLRKFVLPPDPHPVIDPKTNNPVHHPIFNRWWILILAGFFLLGLIHAPPFRRAVAAAFRHFFRLLRVVLIDAPRWLATRPLVQAVIRSQFVRLFFRYVFKPLALAAFVYLFLPDTVSDKKKMFTLAFVFLIVNVLLNSRAGRALEQAILHSLRTTFARFTWDVLASIVRRIVQLFQQFLEAVDRLLYAVDELLRFRAGQKKTTVVLKAIVGSFWFFVAYITRFAINLLVEPQFNPIKHFPVVTVSHKMILPTAPYIHGALERIGIESGRAWTAAGLITLCTPGIFGFLAWEFKENWKLYKANRSRHLKPDRVGSHGETVAQFLRPGFHSGTVPKIFHRLRKAQSHVAAPLAPTNKHLRAAHHVEEALFAFFLREFLAQLNRHPLFRESPVGIGKVHLAATTIRVEFLLATAGASVPLTLLFEQRAAWIVASIERPGWLTTLTPEQTRLFAASLLGLYKLAGVDIIHEHLQSTFPTGATFDFRRNDLVLWPTPDFATETCYDLPTNPHLLFRQTPLSRDAWNHIWQSPTASAPLLPSVKVLPPSMNLSTAPATSLNGSADILTPV